MTRFYTDGVRLYEVASVRSDKNFGRVGGTLTRTVLRDCSDPDQKPWVVDDFKLAFLSEVRRAA